MYMATVYITKQNILKFYDLIEEYDYKIYETTMSYFKGLSFPPREFTMEFSHPFSKHQLASEEIIEQYAKSLLTHFHRGMYYPSFDVTQNYNFITREEWDEYDSRESFRRKTILKYLEHEVRKCEIYKILNKIIYHDCLAVIISYCYTTFDTHDFYYYNTHGSNNTST